ncbi:MAG TPA: PsbP-related protein [Candidatus Limnocylindrales bacterium]|nr:PsbP-related protein [Candidatus Limnocylindrales bacterium]
MASYYRERERNGRWGKKLVLLLAVLAVGLVILFGVVPKLKQGSQPSSEQGSLSENSSERVRVYDAEKYTFGLPDGWKVLEADEVKSLNASGGIKSADDKALATITITSAAVDADRLLSTLERRQSSLPGYRKVNSEEVKIGNRQGVKFTYAYSNNSTRTTQTIYAASANKETYYLAFTAASDEYDRYEDDWNKILSNYRIK